MSDPLRILHLDCTIGRGGQELDHINEAEAFRRRGHLYLIGARPGTFLWAEAQKRGGALAFPLRSNVDLPSFLAIRRLLQKEKIDVLVTTSYIDANLGWFAAISLGKDRPVVVRQRHLLNPPKGLLPFRRFCDALVTVSDIARFGYVERKIPFWKVVSIPRGIPGEESPLTRSNAPLPGIPEGARVILQIGTFQRDKGQLPLLEALLSPLLHHPDLHLVLLGEGPLRPNIERRLAAERFAPVRDRIHLPGFQETSPYYAKTSVLIVSSFREAYPLVILEAFSQGVPVVAFRQGGVIEAFSRGEWGELVPPWNFSLLAERATFWALKEGRASCLEGERAFPPGTFGIDRMVDRTEAYYRWLLERKRSGSLGKNPYEIAGGRGGPFGRMGEGISGP
ncbi:MAG: glycosyltransferase [Leptospirillia bacterium]